MTFSIAPEHSTPEGAGQGFAKQDVFSIGVLSALCLVLFFSLLGDAPLWDIDEGMHAATSKDMVLSGDWITPKMNGENFYDKTAFFNWLVALSFSAFGFTELAARLPAALLGLATVLATYMLGRRLFGARTGLLGGVVLATSPEFIVLSRAVVHDISLAFFFTAALYFFYKGFSDERRRRRHLMLFYACTGLAVLAKGPVGVLLPALIIFLFLLLRGRLDFIREMSLGWGTIVFLAVAAPWYVLISMKNSDYVSYFFLHQNLGNFLSKAQSRHPRPFYYYVPALLGAMLPWSFLVPLALYRPLAGGLKKINDGSLFLVCWFAVIFLFFSAASSKLETYILPAFPALAILISRLWLELMTTSAAGLRKGVGWSLAPLPLLFLATTAYIMIRRPVVRKLQIFYGINLEDISGLLIAVTLILIAAFLFFVFRKYWFAFTSMAATFVVGILIVLTVYVPHMDPYRSTRTLAKEMDAMLPSGEPLVFFSILRDSALFYTNRLATVLETKEQLLDYLVLDKRTLCVIGREQYTKLPEIAAIASVVDEEGNKLLISGNPAK